MKKLLLLPLSVIFLCFFGFKDHMEKSLPNYYITSNKPDPSMKKTESFFSFKFFDTNGKIISHEIKFSYNGVEKSLFPNQEGKVTLTTKPGKYRFQFFDNVEAYEITTDSITIKPGYRIEMNVNFHAASSNVICDKPIIYVYPAQTQAIKINLDLKGKLGFTYPAYENGWNFIADPDGTIHLNDKKYNYLFWEGSTEIVNPKINWQEGFVVSKDSLVPFFESKLFAMGLNSKEIADYITYWVPRMKVNETNYVHFLFNEEFSEYAPLSISPKPDHLFRVFMLWSNADENAKVIPQTISSFTREGFTVVEWGGGEMEQMPL